MAITLHDIQTASGQDFSIVLPFLVVKEVSQLRSESINPTPEVLAALNRIIKVDIDSAAQGIMATVFLVSHILHQYVQSSGSNPSGLDVRVKSVGLPIGAGLGSSAAFSVALSGALVRFRNLLSIDSNSNSETPSTKRLKWDYNISESKCVLPTDAPFIIPDEACLSEINKYAFAAEVVIHGTPSGLDNTTSCYGGALKFSKRVGASFDKLASLPPIHILLTNTRVPRKTSILVGKVGSLLQSFPSVVKPIFDSIEAIVQRFLVMTDSSVPNNVLDFEAEMVSDVIKHAVY